MLSSYSGPKMLENESVLLVEGFWRKLKLADRDCVHSVQGNSDDLVTLEVYEVIFAHQQRPKTTEAAHSGMVSSYKSIKHNFQ